MDTPVFCPKCEGTLHEHSLTNPRIHHPLVRAAQFLLSIKNWSFIHPIVIPRESSDESYIPENFRCRSCGHSFLSSNTYAEEIQHSQKFRKECLFWGLLCLAISVFLAAALILDYCSGLKSGNVIWIYALSLILPLTLSYIFLGGIFFSARESKHLREEWTEFQNVQAKHTRTTSSNSEEHIPAWKRIQSEQQS